MLNYYQPWLLPFLKLKSNPKVPYYYYHSFEDGLWDLIQNKFSNQKLQFLVPNFYCSDVLDNIKNRGHKYTYYPLDSYFQISTSEFQKYLWFFQPEVVILFHGCGITQNLIKDTDWLKELPAHSLIIEDSVHRTIDPPKIKFISRNHYILDSLRKVSPIPGSRLFGQLDFSQSQSSFLNSYYLKSTLYYFLFRLVLNLGFISHSHRLVSFAHIRILKQHDEIIGDEITPQIGLPFFKFVISHFNYQRIKKIKISQARLYQKILHPKFPIPESEFENLHVYPYVISERHTAPPVPNTPVWYKFTDSPWAQDKSVLFLPLGFHISNKEIIEFANKLGTNSSKFASGHPLK